MKRAPWPGRPRVGPPDLGFFARPAPEVARDLLGARIRSEAHDGVVEAVVVETEAYLGPDDPASHAAVKSGRTERNRAMFGPPGRAYVYRSYGVHWCLNVVTGREGDPQAVLIRGVEAIAGRPLAASRRAGREPLGAGPGRVCQALAVSDVHYGHDLRTSPLQVLHGWMVADEQVGITGRIGVSRAADRPLRYFVIGSPGVTPFRDAPRA